MKVREMVQQLQELQRRGYGDDPVLIETEDLPLPVPVGSIIADTSTVSICGGSRRPA